MILVLELILYRTLVGNSVINLPDSRCMMCIRFSSIINPRMLTFLHHDAYSYKKANNVEMKVVSVSGRVGKHGFCAWRTQIARLSLVWSPLCSLLSVLLASLLANSGG